jgi:hypothetical protein
MRKSLFRLGFAVLSSFSSLALFTVAIVACGGDGKNEAKNPTASSSGASSSGDENANAFSSGGASSSGSAGSSGGASGGAASSSGGTSTTTQLGDGGDLQGAKLGGKTHTETESKGDGGPKSTHGQSVQEPGRAAKDIQVIVGARRDEARACYDKALAAHPGIEGDIDIKWVIDPSGNVGDASVDTTKSQILEPSVGTCIIDVIKKIKFAASAKGYETRAHYPFNFHPKTFTAKDAGK